MSAADSSTTHPLTRLPGRAARLRVDGSPGGSLWLGPHHLLQVRTGPLRVGYRRFAYRDIQSIGVRRTARGLVYNVILGGAAGFFGLCAVALAVSPANSVGGLVVLGGIAAACLGLMLVNVARGTTVRSDLRTAVGLYPLTSLSRMRTARRAVELIRQRVEAAQGALSPETLALQVMQRSQPPPPAVPTRALSAATSFAPVASTSSPSPPTVPTSPPDTPAEEAAVNPSPVQTTA